MAPLYQPDAPTRQAMTQALERVERGELAPDHAVALAVEALGRGLGVAALRRLVWWHVEHPSEGSVTWWLHGAAWGETWARRALQEHAQGVARGDHWRESAEAIGRSLDLLREVAPPHHPLTVLGNLLRPRPAPSRPTVDRARARAWVDGVEVPVTVEEFTPMKGRTR